MDARLARVFLLLLAPALMGAGFRTPNFSVTAPTPEMATDLANGLASTFVSFYGDLSTATINASTKTLSDQEVHARKEEERCKLAVDLSDPPGTCRGARGGTHKLGLRLGPSPG